jgi:opacity protein-like surface antigen
MKVQIACLSVLTALAVGPQLAAAADFGNIPPGGVVNGGIKDYGGAGGVPVPAPVPIPDYKPSFYFRIDGGYGLISQPSVSESGYRYGGEINGQNANANEGDAAATLLSTNPSWLGTNFDNFVTYGAGVGYYVGGGWRIDGTIEGRSYDSVSVNGTNSWISYGFLADTNLDGTPDAFTSDLDGDTVLLDRTTHISIRDKTQIKGTVWMANVYYDLMSTRGFTPYVGAGVGLVWNEMQRRHSTTVTSDSNTPPTCGCQNEFSSTTQENRDSASLAAAAMVGASYQISEITSLDLGYRFLYLGGTSFDMNIDGYDSHVSIGDQYVHQLRAGLRFDVN